MADNETALDAGRALRLAGRAGCLLLQNGAEIFRVQETMLRMLGALGVVESNVYVISNGIFATVNEGRADAESLVRHVPLGSVNLSRIVLVNQVSRNICDGKITMAEAERQLDQAENFSQERQITRVLACGLGAAAFCCLFGGSLPDGAAAFGIGMVLQLVLLLFKGGFIPFIFGSMLVTMMSYAASSIWPALGFDYLVIGGIIPLVPGVVFSTSIREFFSGDYLSGVIHMIYAILTAVCIALGVCCALFLIGKMGGAA